MNEEKLKKCFPEYFKNFDLPAEAQEQEVDVYRACSTHKIEKASFLNSFEENNFEVPPDSATDDPQQYSLSTYLKLKDIKRFVVVDSKYQPPFLLAKGHTTKEDGPSCVTKQWKSTRSSHVDWWLYVGAEPWLAFEETSYEQEI